MLIFVKPFDLERSTQLKKELAKASGICLSTDMWTSRAAEAYNTADGRPGDCFIPRISHRCEDCRAHERDRHRGKSQHLHDTTV